jgi:hypothetical protein
VATRKQPIIFFILSQISSAIQNAKLKKFKKNPQMLELAQFVKSSVLHFGYTKVGCK